MTEKRKPWMKWYPADWRAEPKLRLCSRAARSFWMDILGLMHEAEPYGYLIVAGIRPTAAQLAALLGDSERDVAKWMAELAAVEVFSVAEDGTIYSRRMLRDKAKAEIDQRNGRGGGNPNLSGRDNLGVNPPDNHPVNPPDNHPVKAQRPEARGQKEKPEANASGKKKTTLPDDFALTQKRIETAKSKGIIDAELEFERWKDDARANRRLYSDWDAAWRNWCNSPLQERNPNSTRNRGQRPSAPGGGSVGRATMAVIAAHREQRLRADGIPPEGPDHGGPAAGDPFAFQSNDPALGTGIGGAGGRTMPDRDQEPAEGRGGRDADGSSLHGRVIEVPG